MTMVKSMIVLSEEPQLLGDFFGRDLREE